MSITFQVRNVLTNGLLSGINVIAKAIQDEGDLFENETNENGEAHSQVRAHAHTVRNKYANFTHDFSL